MGSSAKLRIIAGTHGGRFITAPPGRHTRPTSERVREAWFSALGNSVTGAAIVDLFAGSGALGIEALSRGADSVHFVESDRRAVEIVHQNLSDLGLEDRAVVHRGDAIAWIDNRLESFDIVLADPPYDSGNAGRLLSRFQERAFASQLWFEHDARTDLTGEPFWTRRYGDSRVSGFRLIADGGTAS